TGTGGGTTMWVESRPDEGTEIATEYVSRADPDGNTLLIISPSFVVLPHLRKLKYDPLTDFAPICELAEFPPLIVVNSQSPYRTLADLIDAAHAQPGVLTLGTLGPATSSQMGFENAQARGQRRYYVCSLHRLHAGNSGVNEQPDNVGTR